MVSTVVEDIPPSDVRGLYPHNILTIIQLAQPSGVSLRCLEVLGSLMILWTTLKSAIQGFLFREVARVGSQLRMRFAL